MHRGPTDYPIHDPAPEQPGIWEGSRRYEWLPLDDPDLLRIHRDMQEGGDGLFLVWCPHRKCKVLIEARWPWELIDSESHVKPSTVNLKDPKGPDETTRMSDIFNPRQYADFREGRLVCDQELYEIRSPVTHAKIVKLRLANRAALTIYAYYTAPADWRRAEMQEKVLDKRREKVTKMNREIAEQIVSDQVREIIPNFFVTDYSNRTKESP